MANSDHMVHHTHLSKMLKTDFKVKYNGEKDEYYVVNVCSELTKNHRDLEQIVSGIMPENRTDPMCPVASFKDYIAHLNPKNKFMLQYALDTIDFNNPDVWYSQKKIGKNPLASFMSDLSKNNAISLRFILITPSMSQAVQC